MSLNRHIDFCLYDDASAASDKFDRIGEVQEIGDVSITADTIENTPYGSDQDDFRGYDYGLKDGGEYTVRIRYNSANTKAQTLADALMNSTKHQVALKMPADVNTQLELNVLVTNVTQPMAKEGKLERTYTLKVSDAPAWNTLVPIA